jgi:hypothetical protein
VSTPDADRRYVRAACVRLGLRLSGEEEAALLAAFAPVHEDLASVPPDELTEQWLTGWIVAPRAP